MHHPATAHMFRAAASPASGLPIAVPLHLLPRQLPIAAPIRLSS